MSLVICHMCQPLWSVSSPAPAPYGTGGPARGYIVAEISNSEASLYSWDVPACVVDGRTINCGGVTSSETEARSTVERLLATAPDGVSGWIQPVELNIGRSDQEYGSVGAAITCRRDGDRLIWDI